MEILFGVNDVHYTAPEVYIYSGTYSIRHTDPENSVRNTDGMGTFWFTSVILVILVVVMIQIQLQERSGWTCNECTHLCNLEVTLQQRPEWVQAH